MWNPQGALVFIITITAGFKSAISGSDIKYVGCYDPGYSISRNYHKHVAPFMLDRCVTICRILKSRYMGTEASDDFCYCGNDIPQGSVLRPDHQCNHPCPGVDVSVNDTCGGEWLISVYDLEPVAPAGDGADSIVNDTVGRNVSFLVGTSVGVRMYSVAAPGVFATITNSSSWAYSLDYHLQRNRVYVYSNGDLYRSTLEPKVDPGSATPTRVAGLSNCEGFAVDWVHDAIYWMDCFTNSLKVMDLDGKGITTLMKTRGDHKAVKRMEVDPETRKLFWAADGTLEWSDLAGSDFRTNLSVPGVYVRALTLDLPSRRVFYVGSSNETASLYELSYSRTGTIGTTRHPSLPQLRSVYGLSALGGYLYWVNYANIRDVVYRLPLNMTGEPEMVRPIERAVWHMRVVDAELQTAVSGDPCQALSCQHVCVPQGGVARCLCPDGMRLQPLDNRTCISEDQSFGYVGCYIADYSSAPSNSHLLSNLTLHTCLDDCREKRVRYAGIDISEGRCHCSDDLTEVSSAKDDEECTNPCPGYPGYTCGGDWLISVFQLANSTTTNPEPGVKFLIGVTNAVILHDPAVHKPDTTTVMTLSNWGYNVDYHYGKNLAFVATKGMLFRSPLLSKTDDAPTAELMRATTSCDGFAVDWVSDLIYLADCGNNSILSLTLEGANETVLVQRPEEHAMIRRMEVDPYQRLLFWVADGVLESCDLSGESFRTNLSDPKTAVRAIALHLPSRTLYYVTIGSDDADYGLFSLRYVPGADPEPPQRVVALQQMRSVYGLGVYGDHVYWMNYANVRDIIYKAPLSARGPDDAEVVKVVEKAAWHMKVVHPGLQSPPPKEEIQELLNIQETGNPRWVYSVALGLLSVVVILILAVVLLYLTDSRWSRLHARVFPRASDSQHSLDDQEPPVYNTSDDRVLLI